NLSPRTAGSIVLDSASQIRSLLGVEDLRIDGAAEQFVPIFRGIQVASNGTIVVPQGQDYQYRFYAANGKLIARYGGHGRGPGELGTSESWSGWTGDTLW